MPHTKSAVKSVKNNELARIKHKACRRSISSAEKKYRETVKSADPKDSKNVYSEISSLLDKAVKGRTIHKNKANRKKSQLARLVAASAKK
ncbi:MAG: 30S ribosomal protein S20 [Lentisphaerae bacterium]|nr:30S ribosomal protein S20 [Lentisphaerota bacterium]